MITSVMQCILHSRFVNQRLILVADVLLSVFGTLLSYYLVDLFLPGFKLSEPYWMLALVSLAFSVLSFWLMRTYKGIIRHSSLVESLRLFTASLLASLGVGISGILTVMQPTENQFVLWLICILLNLLFCTVILVSVRVTLIYLYRLSCQDPAVDRRRRILVFFDDNRSQLYATGLSLSGSNHVVGYLRFGKRDAQRIGGIKLYSIENERDFRKLLLHVHARCHPVPQPGRSYCREQPTGALW